MKIGVFAYNFNHKKTFEGLMRLWLENYDISCIFAQNKIKLTFYQSKIRVGTKDIFYIHPSRIAEKLDIPYHVVTHNSEECVNLIQKYDLDVGVILGARILKDYVINAFKIGIINMHPGVLPENRGLDNLKWAINDGLPQGITTHLIDPEIDWGSMLVQELIDVYPDDTLVDIHLRLQSLELDLMIKSIKKLEQGFRPTRTASEGNYHKALPPELEKDLLKKFEEYKKNYKTIKANYLTKKK
ncbi:MAG: formyltransferase family protein [Candidatus Helarchaeota archaeon]